MILFVQKIVHYVCVVNVQTERGYRYSFGSRPFSCMCRMELSWDGVNAKLDPYLVRGRLDQWYTGTATHGL